MISFFTILKKLLIIMLLFILPPFSALSKSYQESSVTAQCPNKTCLCGYCYCLDFELTGQLLTLKTLVNWQRIKSNT